MVIKKSEFDVCGGECSACAQNMCRPKGEGMVLTKKKVTIKHIPPDTQSLKFLMEEGKMKDERAMSDEELDALQADLLKKIEEITKR